MNLSNSLTQAALVLNRLPRKQSAMVLSRLAPDDIKSVIDALTNLDKASAEELHSALERFEVEAQSLMSNEQLAVDQSSTEPAPIEELASLQRRTPDAAIDDDNPFSFLIDTHPSVRNHLLRDEHPKNVAMVLSLLPPDMASECVAAMEPTLRTSVFRRLCEVDVLDEEEVAGLSFALKLRLKKLLKSWYSKSVGMNVAADLLSCSDSATQEVLLEHMSQSDPDLAVRLNRSVFKIERLETLEDREIKIILKHVDTACWAPALKNAPLSLQKKILDNMAARPAELLTFEIDQIGHVVSLIQQKAEQTIISETLRLAREGKIDLRKNGPRDDGVAIPQTAEWAQSATTSAIN